MIWDAKNYTEQKKNYLLNIERAKSVITPKTKRNLIKKDSNTILKTKISGIYKIVNKINKKYYVGSSKDIYSRWYAHKHYLKHNKHWNDHLQKAYNKYGRNNFVYEVVSDNIHKDELLKVEQLYLNAAKKDRQSCYNMGFVAGRVEMTPETRHKISINNGSRIKSPNTGKIFSKTWRKNISNGRKGILLSKEQKEKLSKIMKSSDYLYDMKPYFFENQMTKENFYGLRRELASKHNLSGRGIGRIVRKERKSFRGWRLAD